MSTVHDLVQGSPEWHAFRLEHFGASEAAAMLGISTKVKRSELLRMKHTGNAKEFSDWVQENILDRGHQVEAMCRPLIAERICEDLYPLTYSNGKLSASSPPRSAPRGRAPLERLVCLLITLGALAVGARLLPSYESVAWQLHQHTGACSLAALATRAEEPDVPFARYERALKGGAH